MEQGVEPLNHQVQMNELSVLDEGIGFGRVCERNWDWNLMLEASTAKHCQWFLGLIAQALPVATERNDSLENSRDGASSF
ncbi:hypothetical protein CEXT_382351 [Caerostris extrusa]|uniref:Uncharacterized protein n=1 Tax=Caerostris extrusa TaxID=172846 RepID=A0AAV4XYQ5_CAEEX|nr:hypothetical protein CEXT_382351 [Caerostris extrusa]